MDNKRGKTSMSVLEMGASLGLRKTDSYWLAKKGYFKIIEAAGVMRVMIDSFEDWYAHQFTYKKVDGTAPGQALAGQVLTYEEIQNILQISSGATEGIISRYSLKKVLIYGKPCIVKESFDDWYASQSHYITNEDIEKQEQRRQMLASSISVSDAAHLLGVSNDTIHYLIKKGCFETFMNGKRKRIPLSSFESWYSGQKHYKKTDIAEHKTGEERG